MIALFILSGGYKSLYLSFCLEGEKSLRLSLCLLGGSSLCIDGLLSLISFLDNTLSNLVSISLLI